MLVGPRLSEERHDSGVDQKWTVDGAPKARVHCGQHPVMRPTGVHKPRETSAGGRLQQSHRSARRNVTHVCSTIDVPRRTDQEWGVWTPGA